MDNLISLFFYLSLFALSASLIFLGQKYRRKSLTFIGLLLPILIATLRFNTGIDYPNYVEISKNLANLSFFEFLQSNYAAIYEPTLFIFSSISQLLSNTDILLFFFYSALTILPFYFAIKRIGPEHTWLAMLVYLLIFFAPSLNAMRQYAAISVTFLATTIYLYESRLSFRHRLYIFLALILGATLVHSSAICMIVIPIVYWFSQKFTQKTPAQNVIYFSIFAALALAIIVPLLLNLDSIPFLNRYSHYVSWSLDSAPTPNPIPKFLPVLVGSLFLRQLMRQDKRNVFYYLLTFVTFASSLFGFIIPYGYRLSDYFFIFQIPLFINIVRSTKSPKDRKIIIVLLISYALFYFIYSSFLNDSHGIFPYQSILFI